MEYGTGRVRYERSVRYPLEPLYRASLEPAVGSGRAEYAIMRQADMAASLRSLQGARCQEQGVRRAGIIEPMPLNGCQCTMAAQMPTSQLGPLASQVSGKGES